MYNFTSLCSLDLESKPNETDEDKNRETRSERHKRVSKARNGNVSAGVLFSKVAYQRKRW